MLRKLNLKINNWDMLKTVDRELGLPQFQNARLGTEVWSKNYYGACGSYSNAIGTSAALGTLYASLSDIETRVNAKANEITQAEANHAKWSSAYHACRNTSCRPRHSKKTCAACRDPKILKMTELDEAIGGKRRELAELNRQKNNIISDISSAEGIAEELAEQGTELAKFGETPESVLAREQARAKNTRLIVAGSVAVALAFTAIYLISRAKKKKVLN